MSDEVENTANEVLEPVVDKEKEKPFVIPNAYQRIASHFDCVANIFASESCYPAAERAKDTADLFRKVDDMLEAQRVMEEYLGGRRDFR